MNLESTVEITSRFHVGEKVLQEPDAEQHKADLGYRRTMFSRKCDSPRTQLRIIHSPSYMLLSGTCDGEATTRTSYNDVVSVCATCLVRFIGDPTKSHFWFCAKQTNNDNIS
ncbi:hypothetical protein L6164_003663 [Bauhinia variegata]|uniref:Uncharacterized protein n=1 Tax=Bauhinia variegata TaxID=167791 RepID=A0ACB9Q207_BAUVA|nr:hypothetical protein L6164_003663 [Bauhinia variegata]